MAGATRPICVWCEFRQGEGRINERPPIYRQELTLRTIDGKLIWLHLQCEQHYRIRDE